ncbi:MAG TPA: hypothetical protein VF532_08235 [Candidatus Angelobacter sp.]
MRPLREALALVLRTPRLWGVQFLGNALIFAAFTGWLHLTEAHWWDVLLNVIVIALVLVAAVVLHGGTLNYLHSAQTDRTSPLTPEFKKALKNFFAIAVWAAVFFFLWFLAGWLSDYRYSFPGYLRASQPSWLRKHTTDTGFTDTYTFLVNVLCWVVLPGLLLPLAALAADRGFRGLVQFREWSSTLKRVSYWIVLVLAVVLGVVSVGALMDWKLNPETATLRGEEASLFVRMLASYLLALFSWLWVCSMLGRLRSAGEPAA